MHRACELSCVNESVLKNYHYEEHIMIVIFNLSIVKRSELFQKRVKNLAHDSFQNSASRSYYTLIFSHHVVTPATSFGLSLFMVPDSNQYKIYDCEYEGT